MGTRDSGCAARGGRASALRASRPTGACRHRWPRRHPPGSASGRRPVGVPDSRIASRGCSC
eukprot:5901433-Prymnesium_polylepis.1